MEEYKITSVSSLVRIFIDQNIEICASPSNVKPTVQCLGPMMMVPRVRFPYLNTISTMLEFDIFPLSICYSKFLVMESSMGMGLVPFAATASVEYSP